MAATAGQRFAVAAQSLVGVPFRLHGRCLVNGLDCVGLVASSLGRAGAKTVTTPSGYALRNRSIDHLLGFATANGFAETNSPVWAGDLLLCAVSAAQFHLVICGPDRRSYIHAHAGLRKVVSTPGDLPWSPLKHWRLADLTGA